VRERMKDIINGMVLWSRDLLYKTMPSTLAGFRDILQHEVASLVFKGRNGKRGFCLCYIGATCEEGPSYPGCIF